MKTKLTLALKDLLFTEGREKFEFFSEDTIKSITFKIIKLPQNKIFGPSILLM